MNFFYGWVTDVTGTVDKLINMAQMEGSIWQKWKTQYGKNGRLTQKSENNGQWLATNRRPVY